MSFIWPWLLLSLLLLPVFVLVYWRILKQRQNTAVSLSPFGVAQNRQGNSLGFRRHLPFIFYLVGIALLMFGLGRPELVVSLPRIEGTVILAFDVSSSMMADDLEPTRLDAAKEAAKLFIEEQPSTIRLGVVAFSNGGLTVQPPTDDKTAVLAAIERLSPEGGTSLGEGIFSSLNALSEEPIEFDLETLDSDVPELNIEQLNSAVIVLLTDGENTNDLDPLQIANIAAQAGIRIYPIGVGSVEGAVLSLDGFNVVTQLNEQSLKEIASLTNADYFSASNSEQLEQIYQNIDLQLAVRGEKMEITAIVSGLAVLFLLIGGACSFIWFGRVP
ncbi:MAG: VWA domain-containing protein [Chloroflexota bacterium]